MAGKLDPVRVFKIIDSGVPVAKAANVLRIAESTCYRILAQGEKLMGRKAARAKRMVRAPVLGNREGKSRPAGLGVHGNRAEVLADLAMRLKSATEDYARRERGQAA